METDSLVDPARHGTLPARGKRALSRGTSTSSGTLFQAFWHGPPLSQLHFAAMRSFIDHGHRLRLYTYSDRKVPDGVELRDAREVLPEDRLFLFQNPQT